MIRSCPRDRFYSVARYLSYPVTRARCFLWWLTLGVPIARIRCLSLFLCLPSSRFDSSYSRKTRYPCTRHRNSPPPLPPPSLPSRQKSFRANGLSRGDESRLVCIVVLRQNKNPTRRILHRSLKNAFKYLQRGILFIYYSTDGSIGSAKSARAKPLMSSQVLDGALISLSRNVFIYYAILRSPDDIDRDISRIHMPIGEIF